MRRINLLLRAHEDGASLVEFAIVAVLLIIVLLSMVEMGRLILVYTTMANAARTGVRYAMVHGAHRTGTGVDGPSGPTCPCANVNNVVSNFASAGLLDSSQLTINVTYPKGTNNAGDPVSVTVTYPYNPLIGYFDSILNKTLGSTSEGIITF